jgi:hypothetical protein
MRRLWLLGVLISACSSGRTIPDGGIACSINADCPSITTCKCPVVYKNCVDGLCSTTCPIENGTPSGQTCGADCECASGDCGVDQGICCPAIRNGASSASCQHDCDCISDICSGGACM